MKHDTVHVHHRTEKSGTECCFNFSVMKYTSVRWITTIKDKITSLMLCAKPARPGTCFKKTSYGIPPGSTCCSLDSMMYVRKHVTNTTAWKPLGARYVLMVEGLRPSAFTQSASICTSLARDSDRFFIGESKRTAYVEPRPPEIVTVELVMSVMRAFLDARRDASQ